MRPCGTRYSLPACTPASPNAPQNARNVLVASDPSSACGLTAKLADLGLSRSIKLHATHHTTCTVRRAVPATGCLCLPLACMPPMAAVVKSSCSGCCCCQQCCLRETACADACALCCAACMRCALHLLRAVSAAQVGTMSHMSPELLSSGRLSTAVDIYRQARAQPQFAAQQSCKFCSKSARSGQLPDSFPARLCAPAAAAAAGLRAPAWSLLLRCLAALA